MGAWTSDSTRDRRGSHKTGLVLSPFKLGDVEPCSYPDEDDPVLKNKSNYDAERTEQSQSQLIFWLL